MLSPTERIHFAKTRDFDTLMQILCENEGRHPGVPALKDDVLDRNYNIIKTNNSRPNLPTITGVPTQAVGVSQPQKSVKQAVKVSPPPPPPRPKR